MPVVLFVALLALSLPIATGLRVWGRRPPAPLGWLMVWCALLLTSGLLDIVVAYTAGNNLWLSYIFMPLEVVVALLMLACWQPSNALARGYRLVIPLILAGTAVVLLFTEGAETFDMWVMPLLSLLALVGTMHTLVHRTVLSRGLLTGYDWFWVCLGFSVYWVGFVGVPVFHKAFISTYPGWVRAAYETRAWTNVAAFLLMTWGMLCQRPTLQLSGRS